MADYSPVYSGGVTPFTATVSAAVVGGTVVAASATGTIATAGAGSLVAVGVAAHDQATVGGKVTVWPLNNCIHEIVATGTVTALDGIATAASGTVATVAIATGAAAGSLIGTALTTATNPNKVRFIGRG